jgi:ribonuclease HI
MPAPFTPGDHVVDRDDDSDSPSQAVVIACPDVICDDWTVPGTAQTVADYNPDYPADDPVVSIAFLTDLARWDGWQDGDPADLSSGVHSHDIRAYTYPASRLTKHESTATTTAPNAEPTHDTEAAAAAKTDTPHDISSASTTHSPSDLPDRLTVWFDGACEPQNPGGHGTYGIVIAASEDGTTLATDCGYIGHGEGVTNNVAEYTALIEALEYVHEHAPTAQITVRGDSQLVIRQLTGEYRVRSERLRPLWQEASHLARDLDITFEWIPREQNEHADGLSRRAYHEHAHTDAITENQTRARAEWRAGEFSIQPLGGTDETMPTDDLSLETATTFEVKETYTVDLIAYSCDCPYSTYRNPPCKHLLGVEWVRNKCSSSE